MRILFCTLGYEPGSVGGAEHQARLQAEALVRRGHQVDVVCPRTRGTTSGRQNGVLVHRLPAPSRRALRLVAYPLTLAVWLLGRRRRYELVHVHLANLQADAVAVALVASGTPIYVKLAAGGPRGEIGRLRRIAWFTRFLGIRRARRVQALSGEIEADLHAIGIPADRIVRIPNGIQIEDAATPDRSARRSELGLPQGVLLLYAGRFATYKGVQDLLAAWEEIADPRATLILVGEQAVDAPLATMPSGDRVIVRGWTAAVRAYAEACDIFVLPSYAEGMSNALLEAMISGMAVVATNVGAAPEMIQPDRSGILVEPGDRDGLAAALVTLIADPERRETLGMLGRETSRSRYGLDTVVDQVEAAYHSILAEAHR